MGARCLKTFEDLGSTDQVQNMGHTETLDWVKLYNQALSSEELPPMFCFWLHHSWKLLWLPSTPFFSTMENTDNFKGCQKRFCFPMKLTELGYSFHWQRLDCYGNFITSHPGPRWIPRMCAALRLLAAAGVCKCCHQGHRTGNLHSHK